jgi:hypothetical protein
MGESPAAQRSEQPGTQRPKGASSFRRGRAVARVLRFVVGLKGARRWRLLWSSQRPLSERSEEMSLSGRQRRGAFKICWSDAVFAAHTGIGVVPSSPPVVSLTQYPPSVTSMSSDSPIPSRYQSITHPSPRLHTVFPLPVRYSPPIPALTPSQVPPNGGRVRFTRQSLLGPARQSHAAYTLVSVSQPAASPTR